ncbi:hypothetical protein B0F90DRAFT_1809060 [Multifurca ochricompacta]|uniref:Protein F37C4.5 n=1 Tax=Multifurca ochricompacta TaxID=376703 RepID=A0AAD4M9V6_9AGAM|nr:hypothetical protein B0F90DRAFT_1809060 [Multifurca ochricompacta]
MTSIIKLNASDYPVRSATVFKSNKAEIVRVFDVSLQPGQNRLQIHHLPGSIDTESARVTGLADARLFDVVCSVGRGVEEIDPASPAEVIRKIRAKKDALVKDLDALDDISDTMVNYSKSLAGDTVSPEQAERFFGNLLARSQSLRSTRAELEEGILQLSRQIDVLLAADVTKCGKADGEVTVVISAKQATDIKLKLTYPACYYGGGVPAPSVSLHYRACITQRTGEDWTDTALTLSTADMNQSNQIIPTLNPTKIRPPGLALTPSVFGAPVPAPLLGQAADEWQDVNTDETTAEESTPIEEPTSVIHESPLALAYHVDGASGVPSDGVPHQVSVAVLPFEAKIQHVTVKNTSDYRLLPGPVNAFVDDSFVSKTAITGDIAPGDVFSCTLGADPATRIRYSRTTKRTETAHASAFSEQWTATTYLSRTVVTNQHPFPLRTLVLRDGVPVSEDERRVNVILRRPNGLADLEQGEELRVKAEGEKDGEKRTVRWGKLVDGKGGRKEGLFEWVFEVGAGEEVTIETEWDVKAPISLKWVESM